MAGVQLAIIPFHIFTLFSKLIWNFFFLTLTRQIWYVTYKTTIKFAIQPLSYLPICLYALEELSIHLQIFDKLSLRGHGPSASYSWTWPLCSCGCTMAYYRGPMLCTWARCWPCRSSGAVPTTHSLTHSLTYPITAAAAAITGQLGLRLPRGINLASADSTIFAYIICLT